MRPFRLGVGVSFLGLMTLLGKDSGGWVGHGDRRHARRADRDDRRGDHRRRALLVGGLLLVTGASTGAILRRTGHVMKRAGSGARRAFEWPSSESQTAEDVRPGAEPRPVAAQHRLLDGAEAYPDVVGPTLHSEESRSSPDEPEPDARERRVGVRDVVRAHASTDCPDRTCSAPSPAAPPRSRDTSAKTADLLVRTLVGVRRRGDASSARSPARASRATSCSSRPGTKVSKVAGAQGRPRLRARDDRDPHPRADPRQAGGRRRGARTSRRSSSRSATSTATCPRPASPLVGLARQGHLRQRRSGPTSRACRTS